MYTLNARLPSRVPSHLSPPGARMYGGITGSLAGLALLAGVTGLVLLLALVLPAVRRAVEGQIAGQGRALLVLAWIVATASSGGSLYFSEVVGFIPCILCWYQRIAMYPLVLVLGVGALTGDRRVWRYALPLSGTGLIIALYHVALQLQPALDVGMCTAGAPCNVRYVAVFGFVSIPVMAAGGFLLISGLVLAAARAAD